MQSVDTYLIDENVAAIHTALVVFLLPALQKFLLVSGLDNVCFDTAKQFILMIKVVMIASWCSKKNLKLTLLVSGSEVEKGVINYMRKISQWSRAKFEQHLLLL